MLKAYDIHKSYRNLEVLKGINLEVRDGEVISIVGASGAGKSTLLHILGSLDSPDSGKIEINNENVSDLTPKALAKFRNQNIGFIFQFHNLLPEFTALENACMPGFIAGKNESELKEKSNEIFDLLGISDRVHHKPSQLSGGEQQRVSVARALINDPTIIFADEPSGNLDSNNAKELHQLFFDLREKMQQTFVIVTHNEELATMADRKLEIRDGIISA